MKSLTLFVVLLAVPALMRAQAIPAAEQSGAIKVGGTFVYANPDYSPQKLRGGGAYLDVDLNRYIGGEFQFHQIGAMPNNEVTERTYVVDARFMLPFYPPFPALGRRQLTPYLKIGGGAGKFNFQTKDQNATYGMYAAGGGLEYRVYRKIDVRVDYEYQRWGSFPPRGLQPNLFSVGASYRIR